LEKKIAEVEMAEQADFEPLVGEEVGAEQIAEVVEAWTGIPTGRRCCRARRPSCWRWSRSSVSD
jgi:ATP-dependent Clp protease ATP-binding subunit ClpA